MREFHFNVAAQIRVRANFQDPANRVLLRFQICEHEHLADAYGRRHPDNCALRKYDHRDGLFFEWLCLGRGAARHFHNARTMNLHRNFQRESIGAKTRRRFRLARGLRNCSLAGGICEFNRIVR